MTLEETRPACWHRFCILSFQHQVLEDRPHAAAASETEHLPAIKFMTRLESPLHCLLHNTIYQSESESEVAQSCPTLGDSMDCSLPGSSIHGIFQARILEWVAISFSSGSSQPRDQTLVSLISGRCFTL